MVIEKRKSDMADAEFWRCHLTLGQRQSTAPHIITGFVCVHQAYNRGLIQVGVNVAAASGTQGRKNCPSPPRTDFSKK
jgi:hypothetical protein